AMGNNDGADSSLSAEGSRELLDVINEESDSLNIVDSTTDLGYSSVHGEQDHERTEEPSRSNHLLLESRQLH
ncbi:MAG TPA: hypothetical protein VFQ43_02975, partial [Nitrososphaera sp.]|nr:hypothetical protein [Nitrososphaera sp.]